MFRQPQVEPGGCGEVWLLTRVALAIILPIMAVMMGVIILIAAGFALLTVHPLLALIPLGILFGALFGFARWDQGRSDRNNPDT